jgi:uncharacterized protein YbjT (DUF2867 family)
VADLHKPKSLPPALEGAEVVFLVSPAEPDLAQTHGHIFDAAREAGVRRIVRVSALGADPSSPSRLLRWHGETEKRLEAWGPGWTHLRPHFFMQNFLTFHGESIRSQGAFYMPLGKARISPIDTRDLAEVAVRALRDEAHVGKAWDLAGPEVLSMEEAARILAAETRCPVQFVDVSPEAARAGMLHAGVAEWLADGLLELYGAWRGGSGAVMTTALLEILGNPGRTFSRFARDHAARWK